MCGLARAGSANAPLPTTAAAPTAAMDVRSFVIASPFCEACLPHAALAAQMLGIRRARNRPARGRSSAPRVRPEDYGPGSRAALKGSAKQSRHAELDDLYAGVCHG
jgi:hypothetical protein